MFSTIKRIHFVGIGGIGMSGIAEILLNQGFEISGSDLNKSQNTEHLEKLGATIYQGHSTKNIENTELVVYSSAVNPMDNPETKAAIEKDIPIIRRAEMLAEVARLNYCLAIAGTHGKTTTTSMLGLILIKAGIDPTVIVGGRLKDFGGTNARLGKGEWTVVEADEYDRSFLQLSPTVSVINNIELEHLDIYKDFEDLQNTFVEFANKIPFYGVVALCLDDPGVKSIIKEIKKQYITFGFSRICDIRGENISYKDNYSEFDVYEYGEKLGRVKLNIPGEHNIKNALAAIAAARKMKISFEDIVKGLDSFHGVFRRFDIKGEKNGVLVIDDYAHHPTEVKATLEATRKFNKKRVIAVFQPHTYTRTKALYKDFALSFDEADKIFVLDVYPARETPIPGVTGELVSKSLIEYGHRNVEYIADINEAQQVIEDYLEEGDLLITLGAGNVCNIADNYYKQK